MNHLTEQWQKLAWGSAEVDEGDSTKTEFWTNTRQGDHWVYEREEDLISAGMPKGQRMTLEQIKRYLQQLLPDAKVVVGRCPTPYMAATKAWKTKAGKPIAGFIFGDDMLWEYIVLHEAAHAINRFQNGKKGAAHGRVWATIYGGLLYEQLGATFNLGQFAAVTSSRYHFEVPWSLSKDHMMRGEYEGGWSVVEVEASNELEARLLALQIVYCRHQPSGGPYPTSDATLLKLIERRRDSGR